MENIQKPCHAGTRVRFKNRTYMKAAQVNRRESRTEGKVRVGVVNIRTVSYCLWLTPASNRITKVAVKRNYQSGTQRIEVPFRTPLSHSLVRSRTESLRIYVGMSNREI